MKKITYTATLEGIDRAEKALKRLGFGSKTNFAKSILISRSTVTKFFGQKPIKFDSFERICDKLTLDWQKIAELTIEESLLPSKSKAKDLIEMNEDMQSISTSTRQVVVIDKQNNTTKAVITLQGIPSSVENSNIVLSILKEYGGNTIVIEDIKPGSIKIFISGSSEDIERLKSRIQSGEITKIDGFPVENIEIAKPDNKWDLIEEIVNHPVKGRNLANTDLNDADLSDADLSDAKLNDANLGNADLSDAKLNDANLGNADLSNADLSNADLSDAKLNDANLRGANLRGANLRGAFLSRADLRDADLSHAFLSRAFLSDAKLNGVNLNVADLSDAFLSEVNLDNANLNVADLRGAFLRGAFLRGAFLRGAFLRGADLRGAFLRGADLRGADLRGADLRGAFLKDAFLSNETKLDEKWRWVWRIVNQPEINRNLRGADLRSAFLRGAFLGGADLKDADLRGAFLKDADLRDADLKNARVENAYFSNNSLGISESLKRDLIARGAIFMERKSVDSKTVDEIKTRYKYIFDT